MHRLTPCAVLAGALIAIPLAAEAQSFRCVGKDGKRYYGQTIPDQCIGQSVEQLDKHGMVVRRIENQSAEDRALRKAEEKKKIEEAATKKEEDRRNRALLATYSSEKDIEEARARALADNQQAMKAEPARGQEEGSRVDQRALRRGQEALHGAQQRQEVAGVARASARACAAGFRSAARDWPCRASPSSPARPAS